jgi:hypothetical protein
MGPCFCEEYRLVGLCPIEDYNVSGDENLHPLQSSEIRIIFTVLKGEGDFNKCKHPKRDTGKLNPQEVEKILDRKEHMILHQQGRINLQGIEIILPPVIV